MAIHISSELTATPKLGQLITVYDRCINDGSFTSLDFRSQSLHTDMKTSTKLQLENDALHVDADITYAIFPLHLLMCLDELVSA